LRALENRAAVQQPTRLGLASHRGASGSYPGHFMFRDLRSPLAIAASGKLPIESDLKRNMQITDKGDDVGNNRLIYSACEQRVE
jgi:hypothetical protein